MSNILEKKINKSSRMYVSIILTWVFCLVYYDPRLLSVLHPTDSFTAKFAYLCFMIILNLFWLYGFFHFYILIFKVLSKKLEISVKRLDSPSVALLYTTRNDFQKSALSACLAQSYPNYHAFVLDDSTDNAYRAIIDEFQGLHSERVTVIRRKDRKGFKAGNLNNALENHVKHYKYFAVIDADEIIPPDFLEKMLAYFDLDKNIAFVQAHHEQHSQQPSKFAQDLAMGIDFHWDVYQPPRNDYGFVVFYGHGAIIRRDVWKEVGGFPEVVSEDLAFATRIRQLGYKGYFVRDITCYEDFPETFSQFRKRHEKWVKGACEYLHREFLPFFLSRQVTVPEKLDVLFSCFSLFIPAIFLVYIFIANAVLPIALSEKHTLSISFMGQSHDLMGAYFLEPRFKNLWTLDFYLITIIAVFSPIFCYLRSLFVQPRKIARLLLKSTVPYVSLILVTTCGILTYLITRKAAFLATGDKSTNESATLETDRGSFWERLNANHPVIFFFELIIGLVLTYFSVKTMNFSLLTISSCLILSPLIARYGWENKVLSSLIILPPIFVLLAFGNMGVSFLGIQGFSLFFLALHF